jgi:phospholipase/carboxylesterase
VNEATNTETILYQNWIIRIRPAVLKSSAKVLLTLHGWTGDENSMQIFQRDLPPEYWIFSPRGPIQTPEGGYGWIGHRPGREATLQAFLEPAGKLHHLMNDIRRDYSLPNQPIELMGFSQGAALSLAYCLAYPEQVKKAAILSGFLPFLPDGYQPPKALANISFFVAHGSEDDIVPIQRAYEVVEFLKNANANANVHFCHSPVSHRISSACFRELNRFFVR